MSKSLCDCVRQGISSCVGGVVGRTIYLLSRGGHEVQHGEKNKSTINAELRRHVRHQSSVYLGCNNDIKRRK